MLANELKGTVGSFLGKLPSYIYGGAGAGRELPARDLNAVKRFLRQQKMTLYSCFGLFYRSLGNAPQMQSVLITVLGHQIPF